MNAKRPTPRGASEAQGSTPPTCETFRRLLRTVERSRTAQVQSEGDDRDTLAGLCAHLEACAHCEARHGARVRMLQGLSALRTRDLPDGAMDQFYAEIRERMPLVAPGGGMSPAFLDAPRALRLWRTATVAATLLLMLGAGFVLSHGLRRDAPGLERPLHDPRERLLEALDTRAAPATGPRLRVRPLPGSAGQGHDSFFSEPPSLPQPVNHGTEGSWR